MTTRITPLLPADEPHCGLARSAHQPLARSGALPGADCTGHGLWAFFMQSRAFLLGRTQRHSQALEKYDCGMFKLSPEFPSGGDRPNNFHFSIPYSNEIIVEVYRGATMIG